MTNMTDTRQHRRHLPCDSPAAPTLLQCARDGLNNSEKYSW